MLIVLLLNLCESAFYMELSKTSRSELLRSTSILTNIENVISTQMQYIGELYIGTPAQKFRAVFDTGSSVMPTQWLWINNEYCSPCHKGSNKFKSIESSTFTNSFEKIELEYGKGSAYGYRSSDMVSLTDGSKNSTKLDFILATQDFDMDGMKADGILGMAFSGLSDDYPTLVESLYKNRIIEEPVFSVYLSNNDYGRKQETLKSNVIFGGSDYKKYSKNDVKVIKVINTGYWSVELQGIKAKKNINIKSNIAILDTGTSLMYGPSSEVNELLDQIKSENTCEFDDLLYCSCNDYKNFPPIEFILDGESFYVNPEEYVLKDQDTCVVLVLGSSFQFWLLGDVFLRSYYTVHDMQKYTISLARSIDASSVKENSSLMVPILVVATIAFIIAVLYLARIWCIKRNERFANRRREHEAQFINMSDIRRNTN